jgi:hypothetical protein
MKLTTITDLADHLGAYEATSESISHHIYEDTSRGCSASFEEDATVERWERTHLRTYVVECRVGIGGTRVASWRPLHGKRRLLPPHSDAIGQTRTIREWKGFSYGEVISSYEYQPLPTALAEHLGVAEWAKHGLPKIGSDWELAHECGSHFMRDLKVDAKRGEDGLLRKTGRGTRYLLTISVKETKSGAIRGPIFSVSGYCEGTDIDCDEHRVLFPTTSKRVDEAISAADKDASDLWKQTHGCEKCHPEGTCDEHGNTFSPDGDNWIGQPVNPDCTECKGKGVIL